MNLARASLAALLLLAAACKSTPAPATPLSTQPFEDVIAPRGAGKTAVLVQFALDSLLRGNRVIHVSIGQSLEKTKEWYEDLFQELAGSYKLEHVGEVHSEIAANRLIMTFNAGSFSPAKLEERLKDLIEHETRFAGRAVQQIYHVKFRNQKGELLAEADSWCFRTERDHAREQGSKYAEVKSRPPRRYSDEELAGVYRLFAAEEIRGATPRYWQDVTVGEPLPKMAKGPMTVTGFIAYAQGWGGLYIRANKLNWKQITRHSGLGIKNRFGIPDCPERVHWEHEFATAVGAPGAYDYGPERCSWLTHHLTNWMGDDGFVKSLEFQMRRPNFAGETIAARGRVRKKGLDGRVDLDLWIENAGEVTVPGTATVILPVRS